MTELEWKLGKENAALKKQVAQFLFNEADRQDKDLGEKWTAPSETETPA